MFGFRRKGAVYHGAMRGVPVKLAQQNGFLEIKGKLKAREVSGYFDLDFDLAPVYAHLSEDERLLPAFDKFKGLRLIRQDPWEALACFIISSNNNMKRIMGIWKNLSQYFSATGSPQRQDPSPREPAYSFPVPGKIARSHERILRQLGLGYRAPFLLRTAQYVSANPACLDVIREAPYDGARERVIAFPGIGPKVADCVLLYGFHKLEAFPVDVWIARAMRKLYFRNRQVSEDRIRTSAKKKWGGLAGYVQQYLFHGIRMGVI